MDPTIVSEGGYRQRDFMVWGGSVVEGGDGRFHMFASRWPAVLGHNAWILSSEVVRAVSDHPVGPYHFAEVVLPRRGPRHWDGMATHNPTIHWDATRGQYCLFYIGTSYAFAPPLGAAFSNRSEYELAWNGKRIGVATAPSPLGPWRRAAAPVIEPREGRWDGGITSNPAAVLLPNGSALLLYKSIAHPYPRRSAAKDAFYLGAAIAPAPQGPYTRLHAGPLRHDHGPVADGGGRARLRPMPLEDPYAWRCGGTLHMLAKSMGTVKALGLKSGQLIYSSSVDLQDWTTPVPVYNKSELVERTGAPSRPGAPTSRPAASFVSASRLERPQLLLSAAGRVPTHGFFAMLPSDGSVSRNVVLPFRAPPRMPTCPTANPTGDCIAYELRSW